MAGGSSESIVGGSEDEELLGRRLLEEELEGVFSLSTFSGTDCATATSSGAMASGSGSALVGTTASTSGVETGRGDSFFSILEARLLLELLLLLLLEDELALSLNTLRFGLGLRDVIFTGEVGSDDDEEEEEDSVTSPLEGEEEDASNDSE